MKRYYAAIVLVLAFAPHALSQQSTELEAKTQSDGSNDSATREVRSDIPDVVDQVQRGMRLRLDLGGRYMTLGNAAPPVTLELDEPRDVNDDIDLTGLVIFGIDRPFGLPLKGDFFGDANFDLGGEPARSPFFDGKSILMRGQDRFVQAGGRFRLYSAFVGVSFKKAPAPLELNIGRQTQMVDSPITYDGGSLGTNLKFGDFKLRAKVWGGVDALNHLPDDPFTRTDSARFFERYDTDTLKTGVALVQKEYLTTPFFKVVAGGNVAVNFGDFGVAFDHAFLARNRSTLKVSYRLDTDFLMGAFSADVKATDFIPRSARVRGDAFFVDGSTRIGSQLKVQFLEDLVAYDGTFSAFNPQVAFDQTLAQDIERVRSVENIRYLNFAPPKPHVLFMLDGERTLIGPFSVNARTRLRHHLNEADVDLFRTNIYEGAIGFSFSASGALMLGAELAAGLMQTGPSGDAAVLIEKEFDYFNEGISNFLDSRVFTRSSLLDGQLNWFNEVFVRRQDLQTRSLKGNGQWSGAFATTLRYDIFDLWAISARVDADLLSPFDSVTASNYFAAHVGSSLQF